MKQISKKKKAVLCKNCGKKTHYISLNGNCLECVENKMNSAIYQLKSREGPVYEKYKQNLIEALTNK